MPKSRQRPRPRWSRSAKMQKNHLRECRERDASELAKATEIREAIAKHKAGKIPWSVIDVLIHSAWPDTGILAGLHRHSLKWRDRHRIASD